jgi:copper(I)-binding protein
VHRRTSHRRRPPRRGSRALALAATVACAASCASPDQGENNPPGTNLRVNDIAIRYAHLEEPDAPGTGYTSGDDIPFYVWLVNESADDVSLVDVSSPIATTVSMDGGQMPVELPPGTLVDLGPDNPHVVLADITTQVRGAQFVPVELTFSDGVSVEIMVEAIEVGPLD